MYAQLKPTPESKCRGQVSVGECVLVTMVDPSEASRMATRGQEKDHWVGWRGAEEWEDVHTVGVV